MKLIKRTYSLPSDTIERFERRVGPGKRSAALKRIMEEWVSEQERAVLRSQVVEGCREMGDVYLSMERDFHALEEETDRELND
jgi:hypothetical protein